MRVSVFRLGYVGAVSAASLAAEGHTVLAVDSERDKVASVNRGRSPIFEPGLDALIDLAWIPVHESDIRAEYRGLSW